jgi:hypothetical protein
MTEISRKSRDWIHLAQDWDHWPAVVNTVMNLRVHEKWGISGLAE